VASAPPLTKWGKRFSGLSILIKVRWCGMRSERVFGAGEIYTSEIVLSDLYDLSAPGTYTVAGTGLRHDSSKR